MPKIRAVNGPRVNDAPELFVDRQFKNPAPLDRRIATVSLHTPTNNPTEGYDLLLSATFGGARVMLTGDELEIDVEFSLTSADIELEFIRCEYALVHTGDGGRVQETKTTISEQSTFATHAAGRIGGQVAIGPSGAGGKAQTGGRFEKAMSAKVTVLHQTTKHDWHRLGGDAIQVGPAEGLLNGPLITAFHGWRVKPSTTDEQSGVIARVKVREDDIHFRDVQVRKAPSKVLQKVRDLLSPAKRIRKEYFEVLLRHLAQSELRRHQKGRDATIAAHVLIVRPDEDDAMSVYAGESRREIEINSDQIAEFFRSDDGHEAGALIALGVKPEMLAPVAEKLDRPPNMTGGKFFVPDSSPPHAAALFAQIHEAKSLDKSALVHPNCLKDLKSLGLVRAGRQSSVELKVTSGIKSEAIFRRAVSDMPAIQVARGVLRINPAADAIDIAEAVALELGKHWPTKGTKKRNGNAIKRWTIWLEPHLLDPSSSSEAAALVAYATDSNVIKGRPPSLRKSLEADLRRLVAEGVSVKEIAARFNVTRATIYNWMNKLDVDPPPRRRRARPGSI